MKSKKVKKISQPQVEIFIRNYDITESTFQKRYKSIPGITKNKNGMFVIPEGTRYPYNMRRLKANTDSKRMYALLDAINRVADGIKKTIKWYLDNKEWWETIISGEYQDYYDKMYGNR